MHAKAQLMPDNQKTYAKIPSTKVTELNNKEIPFNTVLHGKKPNVIIFFSPDCDHCQDELLSIKTNIKSLDSIQFVLVSNKPTSFLNSYAQQIGIQKFKNIKIVSDANNNLVRYYDIGNYPSMVIYDAKKIFKQRYVASMVPISIIKREALNYTNVTIKSDN